MEIPVKLDIRLKKLKPAKPSERRSDEKEGEVGDRVEVRLVDDVEGADWLEMPMPKSRKKTSVKKTRTRKARREKDERNQGFGQGEDRKTQT